MTEIELSGERLISAHRKIPVPFNIQLVKDHQEVTLAVSKLFRVLPGKRVVALAEIAGQKCVVKIFLGKTASRYALKEIEGAQAIEEAGLKAPGLLWKGRLGDGNGKVLAFRYLENSTDLEQMWKDVTGNGKKNEILNECVTILATMHNNGIQQEDIHLNNFVVCDSDIYTIDGGGMDLSAKGSLLSYKKSMENLARFFAQFHPICDQRIEQAFLSYQESRGWKLDTTRVVRLRRKTRRQRRERKDHYVAKTLRECTRFVCESSLRRFMVCERSRCSGDMVKLLADPDQAIENARERGDLLKNGNTAILALVQTDQGPIVIKRYNFKSWWHVVRRVFKKSRARVSWINSHQLNFLGIPSVSAIAMLEDRLGIFTRKAYFFCNYIEGQSADNYFADVAELSQIPQKADMINIVKALRDAMISHGDLKASNFLITQEGQEGQEGQDSVVLLDLDAMKGHKYKRMFKKSYHRDISRFLKNWTKNPELYRYFKSETERLTSQ